MAASAGAAGKIQYLKALVGTHAALTATSLAYGIFGGDMTDGDPPEVYDAHHYDMVTELVSGMYAGRGLDKHTAPRVKLADTVTFEDPAVICSGPTEVREAFRALTYIQPKSRSPPRCIDVQPQGDSVALTYVLNQQYAGMLTVRSLLVVHVQLLHWRDDFPDSEFLVTRLEEQWNAVPPLGSLLFWIVRRINGFISYQLTSRMIVSVKKK
jgi:hypothetical protein